MDNLIALILLLLITIGTCVVGFPIAIKKNQERLCNVHVHNFQKYNNYWVSTADRDMCTAKGIDLPKNNLK